MEKFIGYDKNGIARVYADTYRGAVEEIKDYVTRRPDTGPTARWTVEKEGARVKASGI